MPNSASFSHIFIIQSLPPGQESTGARLHEDLMSHRAFHGRKLSITLTNVADRMTFISALDAIHANVKANGIQPIIHIECHGAEEGLEMADGSSCNWLDLKPYLVSINTASRCNLLVTLAACFGAYLTQVINLAERAPFWGMIGPPGPVQAGHLLSNLTAFYTTLLDHSREAIALPILLEDTDYLYTSAETVFKYAYVSYLKMQCSKKAFDDRASSVFRKAKCRGLAGSIRPGAIRRRLAKQLHDDFEAHRRVFFMIDLFSENDQRFPLRFDEVKTMNLSN